MLTLFRRNLFINIAFLLIFGIGLTIYGLFKPTELQFSLPFDDKFEWTLNTNIAYLFNFLLLFVQAILVSRLVISHKLSRELSLIPGAVFLIFSVTILDPYVFHHILIANLFFLFCLNNLFDIYKKYKPISTIFNAGFFLGIATSLYFPYAIFLITHLIGLNNLRSLKLRESLQLVFGFVGALFLIGVAFFHFDLFDWYLDIPALSIPSIDFNNWMSFHKLGLFFLSLLVLIGYAHNVRKKKKYDAIRKLELTYALLFLSIFSIFLVDDISYQHLLLTSIPISILGGIIFELKEKVYIKEFVFLALIGFYILVQLSLV